MGNKSSSASSPQKGSIKAPGYLASVLPFLEPGDGVRERSYSVFNCIRDEATRTGP